MIKHLSPSSLALFKAQPKLWIGKYLLKWQDSVGPSAWRGSAVEAGLDEYLFGTDKDRKSAAYAKAQDRFELEAQGESKADIDKQRDLIRPMLDQAQDGARSAGAGTPNTRQVKVEVNFPRIEFPIIGYVDYEYGDFFFDLKSTERMPSEPKPDHALQVSIYSLALGKPGKLLYVTPKKFQWYDVTPAMVTQGINEAKRLAANIEALLALSDDPLTLLRAIPGDYENFRWNEETRKLALEAEGEV